MGIEMEGFDELQKELQNIADKAEELDGKHKVPIRELFNNEFISRYTKFKTIEDFFRSSPWDWENDDLEDIPEAELDDYIRDHSHFSSWEEMLGKASDKWAVKQLGLD